MIDTRLQAIGVWPARIWKTKGASSGMSFLGGVEAGYAQFSPLTWSIDINEADLADGAGHQDVANLVGSVYHEARHAEQHFLVIRYLVGANRKQDLAKLHLSGGAVHEAGKNPLTNTTKTKQMYQLAERLYPSLASYGDLGVRVENQKKIMLAAMSGYRDWVKYWIANQSERTRKNLATLTWAKDYYLEHILRFQTVFNEYQSSVAESDAWAVQGEVVNALGFKAKSPQDTFDVMNREKDKVLAEFANLPPVLPPRD